MTPNELNALRKWVVAHEVSAKHERRTRVAMHRAFGFGTDPQGDASHHEWACPHCNASAVGGCLCHVDKGWVKG